MKNFLFTLLTVVCFVSHGQNALTDEMINKINLAEKQDIFSVAETVKFDGQILKADEIVFAPNSVLELTNLEYPWIIIIADKIKFTAPLKKAIIRRNFDVFAASGVRGSQGANGSNGTRSGRHGTTGGAGESGEKGGAGETKQLPKVYIVTNSVIGQESEQAPDFINLKLIFPGVDGGNGGTGGIGGNGGRGGNGRDGSDGPFDCRSGAGDGGNGGIAGKGGQGGDAGNGGNGSDIIFIGSEQALEVLSYSIIINTGGDGGIKGQPGISGSPGSGGNRGNSSTHCGWGDRGKQGAYPSPKDNGYGKEGAEGEKGKVNKYLISEYSNIAF